VQAVTGPWPAEANENALRIGSRIVISTPSRAVRLATADQLSIHTTEGTEIAAIVLNKSGARMRLSLFDGRYAHLALIVGDAALSQADLSRQKWRVVRIG
jgi:hypothetical protein